ncbi:MULTISPECIES: hypothetical protein [Haloarcula]|uniref:LexA-binding, inner membrane-associated hydrolase n=1 Tax=Haloarcula pellucida TaxID=1427151 RepID=A0A830GNY3_9EURY|nr:MULTISPECIES: hypothetical protein [Halomicroarcula]MBX0350238.1 hypothetical protein [Halomicroarcula pellucida]MDS0277660.1 hypothetical protein [Halomicroarcula sp. S1AR25-4]GGO01062.1 hypothetical protein GCM10009030_34370 [Halomicroarcula pellucida]
MYSRDHAILSVLAGLVLVAVTTPPVHPVAVVVVAVALGVGIDFDHFLVAYLNTGSAESTRRVLRDPRVVVTGQDDIFEEADLSKSQRLLSHVLIAGALVTALWLASAPYWALVVGVTLYVHVVADLYADAREMAGG